MMTYDQIQPKAPDLKIPFVGDKAVYSLMDEFSLRRLHKFIGELIEWKAAGNGYHHPEYYAIITEKTK